MKVPIAGPWTSVDEARTAIRRFTVELRRAPLLLPLFLLSFSCATIPTQKDEVLPKAHANLPAVLWRDPGEMASLNLLYGAGGQEHAPDSNGVFTFLKEDLQATSPKFDVRDERGVEWKVKLDEEPQSETAATRFLWAAGFFVDEDYYLPEFRLTGDLSKLRRGRNFITRDGKVKRARFERKIREVEKLGGWDWFSNPFVGTREFNGLRTMVSFLNDWDLKAENNSVYTIAGEHRYLVSDVGATFGRTGSLAGSQSSPRDYAASKFILRTTPELVDFELRGRPFFLLAIDIPHYVERSRMEAITRRIPRVDAQWIGHRLAMLSPEQIRDGFRSAGYTPEEVEAFTQVVRKRIAALDAL
jgi:hypothetical protein